MTNSLEKIFFSYILKNKRFFDPVDSYFFKNKEIEFVYKVIRKYMLSSDQPDIPRPKQILEMVNIEDKDSLITKETLKSMLSLDLSDYDEKNFIQPRFNSWVLFNRLKNGTVDIVDEVRNLDSGDDWEDSFIKAQKIRDIVDKMTKSDFINDDEDLGSDFDDPESHVQDSSKYKVKTGFPTIDHMLGGGWDVATLNVIMASTNNGKSLWMQNFAIKSADLGYNVLYITLEMSQKKVMKRLGSMRLKVPINDYDRVSNDVDFIKSRIESMNNNNKEDIFNRKWGKLFTKFWAAGTATTHDFLNYINKLQSRKGIKIDLLIVDYITLIAPNGNNDSLYLKGKNLAEGLRAVGAFYNIPVVTGIQVSKDAWNSNDITLDQAPESKAIPETADTFFAIIRTEEMKRNNIFRFKLLKQRDGDFLKSQVMIKLNPVYLTLEDDVFLDSI